MSIGQGNIIVQSKKEQGGTLNTANNGLSIGGGPDNVQLGGGLVQETHIGLTTAGTFSIDGGGVGGQSVLYFDEDNTQYFYGIVGAGPVFITGMEITPVGQLFLYAAQKKAVSAVQGFTDLVVTVGDVDIVGNGTKIRVDDNAQTVEITNVPTGAITDDFATFDDDQIKKIPAPIESGTYTPTVVAGSNVASIIEYPCQYLRVGQVVNFSGQIEITVTTPGITSDFTINPPISTAIGNVNELSGAGIIDNASSTVQSIVNDGTGNAFFSFIPAAGTTIICFNITYLITVTTP